MLIRYPHTEKVNEENYYQEYKGHTKWLSLIRSHFAKKRITKGNNSNRIGPIAHIFLL